LRPVRAVLVVSVLSLAVALVTLLLPREPAGKQLEIKAAAAESASEPAADSTPPLVRSTEETTRRSSSRPRPDPEPEPRPRPDQAERETASGPKRGRTTGPGQVSEPAPVSSTEPAHRKSPEARRDWPAPRPRETEAADRTRRYEPRSNAAMTLTIKDIGLRNVPVFDEESRRALDEGVIHVPETPMPWDVWPEKNVYLAAHRLGYPGTGSRLLFYRLPELRRGDEIVLEDRRGTLYRYEVSQTFVVSPRESWVVQPVRGRDLLTLQTCVGPGYSQRLIVRADRVRTAALGLGR
jgi:sortase A